ncbi:hypothetical protein MASR1M59_02360 [Melaminivora sp.]
MQRRCAAPWFSGDRTRFFIDNPFPLDALPSVKRGLARVRGLSSSKLFRPGTGVDCNMRYLHSLLRACRLLPLGLAVTLAACGGGSDGGEDVGPPSGTQQYPGGIWEGSVGTGTSQRVMVGFIDGGVDGKGGEFYFARGAAGAAGYDSLYGLLRTQVATIQATGVTYFSVQDGKFANGLTLRGTASSNPVTGRTTTISGNYTSPNGTAAASGATSNFKLTYSPLNNFPGRADLLAGTYRGAGMFGGQWVLAISARGLLSGRIGNCNVQGTATPRAPDSAVYSITMSLIGDENTCAPYSGTQQVGIAVLRYEAAGKEPNGIWIFTRNASGTANTYVLDGLADPKQPTIPSPVPLSINGNWAGTLTLPAGVIGDEGVWGSVLPDGGFFLYTNSSFNHDALYGRLIRYDSASLNRFVTANDGVFFNRLAGGTGNYQGGYIGGVLVDATLESAGAAGAATRMTGTYSYNGQLGGYPTRFTMQPDPLYTLPAGVRPNINLIVGNYRMQGASFGGHTVDISVAVDGSIVGSTSNGCKIVGKLSDLPNQQPPLNLYRVEAFGYLSGNLVPSNTIGCELSTGPSQSGAVAALFDQEGRVSGLRLLTAGLQISGQRAHTVFVGNKR